MAGGGAGIAEGLARNGDELPSVTALAEGELQYAPGFAVAGLAGLQGNGTEGTQAGSASADNKLTEAAGGVGAAGSVEGSEALVVVIVAGEDDVGASVPQGLPETLNRFEVAVAAGAEPRMVPDGQGAGSGMTAEFDTKPLLLG